MTPAERQAKCRAIKRGTWETCQMVPEPPPEELESSNRSRQFGPPPRPRNEMPTLPAAAANSPGSQRALPAPLAPPSTAIQKSASSGSTSLAPCAGDEPGGDAPPRWCLPPAVAARLRSLLDRHKAGKHLTAAEQAEAEGLLDIAEYFVVQRMRRQLAA
jgi:hypothetical protein